MLSRFLRELFGTGAIVVERAPLAEDAKASVAALAELEALHRAEMPGVAPPWSPDVSRWAAHFLYDACRAFAHRDMEAADVGRILSVTPPPADAASAHYSADLIFRALPDLVRLARGIAADDPLTVRLAAASRAWPLSSVGLGALGPLDVEAIAADACLLRLYADRVIERRDASRLDDSRVVGEVRRLLGALPPPPELARRLLEGSPT